MKQEANLFQGLKRGDYYLHSGMLSIPHDAPMGSSESGLAFLFTLTKAGWGLMQ